MNEHDDDLASTVVEGEEIERDAFVVDEDAVASVDDEEEPDSDGPSDDDAEL